MDILGPCLADLRRRVRGSSKQPASHLFFFEEVLIYMFENKGFFDDYAAVMFDREGCKFGAVYEDKACIDAFGVVPGVGAETRRSDEDSAASLGAVECPDKGLDVWTAYVAWLKPSQLRVLASAR